VTTTAVVLLAIFGYLFLYPAHHSQELSSVGTKVVEREVEHLLEVIKNQATADSSDPKNFVRGKPQTKTKIAYIFAGSVRSFTCPRVHWSLRWNLIDALGGEAYTFIRTSTEDNANVKTGKGAIWKPKYDDGKLNSTLQILNPRKIEYFQLSTQLEEMRKLFPSMAHRVFQENDQRRYSMFFHRCMAYRMVLEYEKNHNIRFDWVALTRLDAAWLEPVLPIELFTNDRVWLTETGYVPFNDQFMLIPRQYADYLYDLDTKVDPFVYCLGGPDVEEWKCRRQELEKRYPHDSEFVNATLQHCCKDNVPDGPNRLGYSETIHFRHLLNGKIPVGFARLPVYLTRLNKKGHCSPECARLYHNFKSYIYDGLDVAYPYFAPLNNIDNRMIAIPDSNIGTCTVLESRLSVWNPISAHDFHRLQLQGQYRAIDYGKNLYTQWDSMHPSIVFNPFLMSPWKVRTTFLVDKCLTSLFANKTLWWEPCRTHMRFKGGRRHHPAQSWYLHVRPHDDRILLPMVLRDTGHDFLLPPHLLRPNMTQIFMPKRDDRWYEASPMMLCLTAAIQEPKFPRFTENITISFRPCSTSYQENPQQFFQTVQGETFGANGLVSTVAKIVYAANPQYCLVRDEDTHTEVRTNFLSLGRCEQYSTVRKYFQFDYLS
jgi:hypothetical protein